MPAWLDPFRDLRRCRFCGLDTIEAAGIEAHEEDCADNPIRHVRPTVVELEAKTRKGKNVITNHGPSWKVLQTADNLQCMNGGTGALIESLRTAEWRWVAVKDDPDFEIIDSGEMPRGRSA